MSKNGQPPTGVMMMLKAMGIEFDPQMFEEMRKAVLEIRDRLKRIEEKVDKLSPVCSMCGEETAHKCKLENLGGHSIVPANPPQEKSRATNRS